MEGIEIPEGYSVLTVLLKSEACIVYKALAEDKPWHECILKYLGSGYAVYKDMLETLSEPCEIMGMLLEDTELEDFPYCEQLYECLPLEGDRGWFALEFIDGMSLYDFLNASAYTPFQKIECLYDLVGTLSEWHRRGFHHGDLRPENVVVDKCGVTRIFSWGITRRPHIVDDRFVAPEHFTCSVGPWSDVYVVGGKYLPLVVNDPDLIEACTREPHCERLSMMEVAQRLERAPLQADLLQGETALGEEVPSAIETKDARGAEMVFYYKSNVVNDGSPADKTGGASKMKPKARRLHLLGRIFERPALLAAGLLLVLSGFFAGYYFFTVNSRKTLIAASSRPLTQVALVACDEATAKFTRLVGEALDADYFQPVEGAELQGLGSMDELCASSTPDIMRKIAEPLGLRYVLLGRVHQRGTELLWLGRFVDARIGSSQPLEIQAKTYAGLVERLVGGLHEKIVGDGGQMTAFATFYSARPEASFLYSEGLLQYESGRLHAARAMFKRAATIYDRDFDLAAIELARCLVKQGASGKAVDMLTGLMNDKKGHLQPLVQLEAYKVFAVALLKNRDRERLESLLAEIRTFLSEQGYERDRGRFMLAEARLYYMRGEVEDAECLAKEVVEVLDPDLSIDAALFLGELPLRDFDQRLAYIHYALWIARQNQLEDREREIIACKAGFLVKAGAANQIEGFLHELDLAELSTHEWGDALAELKLRYWRAVCLGVLNDRAGQQELMRSVARDAGFYGAHELELRARLDLNDNLVMSDSLERAVRELEPLGVLTKDLAPELRLLLQNRLVRLRFQMGDFEAVLKDWDLYEELARVGGDRESLGIAMNTKGATLHKLNRFQEASHCYVEALRVLWDTQSNITIVALENMISLQRAVGDTRTAAEYTEVLDEIRQGRKPQLPVHVSVEGVP